MNKLHYVGLGKSYLNSDPILKDTYYVCYFSAC